MNSEISQTEARTVAVPWTLDGKRFDVIAQILAKDWFSPALSRSFLQEAISNKAILLQGSPASPSQRLSKGDSILFTEDFFQSVIQKEDRVAPKQEEPTIINQNDSLIVLYKPAGWLTHEVSHYQKEASLEDWMLQKGLLNTNIPNNGRVHRLDRNTSGVVVYAKTFEAQAELKDLFEGRRVKKTYIALVEGQLTELSGTISAPIIRKPGSFKRIIASSLEMEGAREAETRYQVIARYQDYDLVLLTPKTGRTHQIRVHMAHLGHPLAGDSLYGGKKSLIERQFLHAWELELTFGSQKYRFTAPLADDLKKALVSLDESMLTRYDNEALQSIGLKLKTGFFSLLKDTILKTR